MGSLMTFPVLAEKVGIDGIFYCFSALLILLTPFVFLLVPETKDLSLEVIEYFFLPNHTTFYVDINR